MDCVRDELEELEIQNHEQKAFIPQDALKRLFDENKINAIVTELSDTGKIQVYEQEEIVRSVLGNGLRLFATLISLSRPELILKFIEADYFAASQLDSKLPFTKQAVDLILKDDKLSTRFEKHQWRFFLPFFSPDQSHRELGVSTRLPFVRCEHLGEGGFGEVYKMFLPASCQGLVTAAEGEVDLPLVLHMILHIDTICVTKGLRCPKTSEAKRQFVVRLPTRAAHSFNAAMFKPSQYCQTFDCIYDRSNA